MKPHHKITRINITQPNTNRRNKKDAAPHQCMERWSRGCFFTQNFVGWGLSRNVAQPTFVVEMFQKVSDSHPIRGMWLGGNVSQLQNGW